MLHFFMIRILLVSTICISVTSYRYIHSIVSINQLQHRNTIRWTSTIDSQDIDSTPIASSEENGEYQSTIPVSEVKSVTGPKAAYTLRSTGSTNPVLSGNPNPTGKVYKSQYKPQKEIAPINENIKVQRVRLIATDEETDNDIMLGIMSLAEAQQEADKRELDLVLINEKGDPPVCKIIDYGKYKYAVDKRKKENMKKQAKSEIKEVTMSYKIDQHDFDVRLRAVQKFIGDGDRVKITIKFKGREMQHKDLGKELLLRIYKPVEEITVMESPPKEEGRAIAMLLGPKK